MTEAGTGPGGNSAPIAAPKTGCPELGTAPEREKGFSAERLARLAEIERWHFWFAGRRALLEWVWKQYRGATGGLVLDLGCGTGAWLEVLRRDSQTLLGIDLLSEGLQKVRSAAPGSWLVQAEATQLPLPKALLGHVLMLDVLEHVDDRQALAEVHRVLSPQGRVILMVPAIAWLWSYRDVAAGHLRRYSRGQIMRVCREAGFSIELVRRYQFLLLPLIILTRLLGRRGPRLRDLEEAPHPALNAILRWANVLEAKLSRYISWPWGSSILVVCTKP